LALLPLGVLPVLLLIAIITKRQRVKEPFCREHENHFFLIRVLRAVGWFGFLVAPVLFILGAAANPKGNLAGYLCCGWIVLMVVYLVVVRVFALLTKIRPTDITDRSITLTNVSDDFADAMEEDEEDDWDRPAERQKRRRRGDDRYQGGQGRSPRRSTDNSEEGPIV
jgi:hypothetical protein